MQGDFSKLTFQREKHYRLVMRQQGRVDVDADWNEQQQILRHFSETEAVDVIGPTGYPKGTNSFAIAADAAAASGLTVAQGRMYVDGILCENDAAAPLDLFQQPDFFPDNGMLAGVALPPAGAATFVAYLEVFLRHVTARQDPAIREKALGGPDTASRAKVVWQVKLQPVGIGSVCSDFAPPAALDGQLKASAIPVADATTCSIPPTAGYRRLENQLYRVEVHLGSDEGVAPTFKWSRENASIVTNVVGISGQTITVTDLGRDDVTLGFKNAQWVELIDDRSELGIGHGTLLLVDSTGANSVVIKPDTPVPVPVLGPGQTLGSLNYRLRRWEQTGPATGAGAVAMGIPVAAGPIALEDGLQVEFQGTGFHAGDYWLIPARTAIDGDTGNIEWPSTSPGNFRFVSPFGVKRHYCPLAVVSYAGGGAAPVITSDCRKPFPPLTNITASDVTVANNTCSLPGVTTVQQQIDALCLAQGGCCATMLSPDMDWQSALKQLPRPRASVCFQVGDYVLDAPIRFSEFSSLKITGNGPGTSIKAPRSQAAFVFEGCQSVEVSDLHVEAGQTGGKIGPNKLKGAGVLTFRTCSTMRVEAVSITGAEDVNLGVTTIRTASCIEAIGNPDATPRLHAPTSIRVAHCDLTVGRLQEGIVVADVDRVQIEDNTLTAVPTTAIFQLEPLLTNLRLRANVRRFLLSQTSIMTVKPTDTPPKPQAPAAAPDAPAPAPHGKPKRAAAHPKEPEARSSRSRSTLPPAGKPPKGHTPDQPEAAEVADAESPSLAPAVGEPGAAEGALPRAAIRGTTVTLNVGGSVLKFQTPNVLANAWSSVLALPKLAARPGETPSQQLSRAADQLLLNAKLRFQVAPVASWWAGLVKLFNSSPIPAAQGIVVGGSESLEVRIRDNTVIGASQGIHVGLSRAGAARSFPVNNQRGEGTAVANNVMISRNTVTVIGSVLLRGHEGIFVGNCDNLVIENNALTAVLPPTNNAFPGEGIRVFGWLGPFAAITRNRLRSFSQSSAVVFHPLGTAPASKTWVVSDNQTVG